MAAGAERRPCPSRRRAHDLARCPTGVDRTSKIILAVFGILFGVVFVWIMLTIVAVLSFSGPPLP